MLLMILEQPIFIVCYYIDIGNTVISELNKNDNFTSEITIFISCHFVVDVI